MCSTLPGASFGREQVSGPSIFLSTGCVCPVAWLHTVATMTVKNKLANKREQKLPCKFEADKCNRSGIVAMPDLYINYRIELHLFRE
jgi:hypothetical protein